MTEDNLSDIEIRLDMERVLEQLSAELKEITILFFFQGLAEDMAQETFVRFFEAVVRYGDKGGELFYTALPGIRSSEHG